MVSKHFTREAKNSYKLRLIRRENITWYNKKNSEKKINTIVVSYEVLGGCRVFFYSRFKTHWGNWGTVRKSSGGFWTFFIITLIVLHCMCCILIALKYLK